MMQVAWAATMRKLSESIVGRTWRRDEVGLIEGLNSLGLMMVKVLRAGVCWSIVS